MEISAFTRYNDCAVVHNIYQMDCRNRASLFIRKKRKKTRDGGNWYGREQTPEIQTRNGNSGV